MVQLIGKTNRSRLVIAVTMVSFLIGMGPFPLRAVYAADLQPRALKISDSTAAHANTFYEFRFNTSSISTIGSVRLEMCSNTPFVDVACVAPPVFDDSAAVLAGQTNSSPFTLSGSGSTSNTLLLTRPPTVEASSTLSFTFSGITNPGAAGSYYARIFTYPSSDGSGPYTYANGLVFAIAQGVGVELEVPPYIRFCLGESITNFDCTTATEPFSDLGDLSPNITSAAQSQMVIATNAESGYSMWVTGATMMSGGNVINAMNGGTSAKGSSQFGLNLVANNTPQIGQNPTGPGSGGITANYNQQNHFRFNTGDVLATAPQPDDNRKYTVSYIVNIPAGTPGGVYSTTLTYVCLANF